MRRSFNRIFSGNFARICRFLILKSGMSPYYVRKFYKHNKGEIIWGDKKSAVTISFDCDLPGDVKNLERIVEILDGYDIKSSFACVGKWVEKYTRNHRLLIDSGHEIMNHTYTHPNNEFLNPDRKFNLLSRMERFAEIRQCDNACVRLLGYKPRGFRSPHFGDLHTEDVYEMLRKLGYKYSSSTISTLVQNHGLPYHAGGIMEIPVSASPLDCFSCLETWEFLRGPRANKKDISVFLDSFKKLIDIGIEANSYMNFYFDPVDLVRIEKTFTVMLDYIASSRNNLKVLNYEELHEYLTKG